VQNTSTTASVTFASAWASGSDDVYTFRVKVWDSTGLTSAGYSDALQLTPSVKVNPTIVTPVAASTITTDTVTMTWTVAGTSKNEKQKLDIRRDVLQTEEETFALNTNISLMQKESEMEKFNALIDKDQAIISIRNKIKETASSQLNNGVITATDFVDDLYAENQARLNLELHHLQLVKTQVEYQNLLGK
jgi:hypothetical protein